MLSDKLITAIEDYRMQKDFSSYNRIRYHLSTYLQFRKIVFLFEEFDWYIRKLEFNREYEEAMEELKNKEPFSSRKEKILDDEFLSEKELEEYKEYMDGLPDNYHPHSYR